MRRTLAIAAAMTLLGCKTDEPLGFIGAPPPPPGFVGDLPPPPDFVGDRPPPPNFAGWNLTDAPDFVSEPPPGGPESIVQGEDRTNGGGAALMDFTGDGALDLVLTAPWSGSAVYVGDGQGGFSPVPNPDLEAVPLAACAVGVHLNDDELRDLLLCGDSRLSAWRNEGGAVFSHVVDVLDLSAHPARPEDISVSDCDGDGALELYVGVQSLGGEPNSAPTPVADHLLRLTGPFTFEDLSDRVEEGALIGQTYASTWVDIDGDRDLDLFAVRDRGNILQPAILLQNPGSEDGTWEDIAPELGLALQVDGMGVDQADLEGDGTLELVVSDNWSRLHVLSMRDGVAVPVGAELGAVVQDPENKASSWATEFVDVENDGDLDLVVAFGRVDMLHDETVQTSGAWLWEPEGFTQVDGFEHPQVAVGDAWRTVLPGDIDSDGQLELVFTSHVGGVMIQDPTPDGNEHLEVRLVGPPGNPDGLGALVRLRDGTDRDRWHRIGIGDSGVHSSLEPTAHFGLGRDPQIAWVQVVWSDDIVTEVEAPPSGVTLEVRHPLAM